MSADNRSPHICSRCGGNGKCAACNGTGINTHLNEDEPKCADCTGSGVCAECNGTGRTPARPPEILDLGLNKL